MIKSIPFQKLFFTLCLSGVALFTNASSVFAGDAPLIVHETDTGSTVNLTVGQVVEFSLAENIPNTTSWTPFVAWVDTADSIKQIGSSSFDGAQTPAVLNFFYTANKTGQNMLVFYKNGMSAGIPDDIVQHPLIFMVDVK